MADANNQHSTREKHWFKSDEEINFSDAPRRFRIVMDILRAQITNKEPITDENLGIKVKDKDKKEFDNTNFWQRPKWEYLFPLDNEIRKSVPKGVEKPPTIIALVVLKSKKMPGKATGKFSGLEGWNELSDDEKINKTRDMRETLYAYPHWNEIYKKLFDRKERKDWSVSSQQAVMNVMLEQIAQRSTINYTDLNEEAANRSRVYREKCYHEKPFYSQISNVLCCLNEGISDAVPKGIKSPPAISALAVYKSGKKKDLPGHGIKGFAGFPEWDTLTETEKRQLTASMQDAVFSYKNWSIIYKELFHQDPPDYDSDFKDWDVNVSHQEGGYGGGESDEHANLKNHVAGDPGSVNADLNSESKVEFALPSGDSVDVAFLGREVVLVEVKSRKSNYADKRRGIYQCVKYREVYLASLVERNLENANIDNQFVRSVLVTETELPEKLKALAKKLNVETKTVPLS